MLKSHLKYRMVDKNIDDITQLIELSGVSRNAINKLYRNRDLETLKLGTVIRLCEALDCQFSDIVEYIPEEKHE